MAEGIIIRPYQPFGLSAYAARSATPFGDMEAPETLATRRMPMGMTDRGNVNIMDRPSVPNGDGRSTVYSMSFDDGGRQVLVPLVNDAGGIDTPDQAVDRYRQSGKHLGKFATPETADAYAQALHLQQEEMVNSARAKAALSAWGY